MYFLEEETVKKHLHHWINDYDVEVKFVKGRKVKLGDYSFSREEKKHKITVNNDLSDLAKFFVLSHEIGHLLTRVKYGRYVKPHGKEWKSVFSGLILESIDVYPKEYRNSLIKHAKSPKANLFVDFDLYKKLFPNEIMDSTSLKTLEIGSSFIIKGRKFKIKQKKIKRYLCRDLEKKRDYLINANALVKEIK